MRSGGIGALFPGFRVAPISCMHPTHELATVSCWLRQQQCKWLSVLRVYLFTYLEQSFNAGLPLATLSLVVACGTESECICSLLKRARSILVNFCDVSARRCRKKDTLSTLFYIGTPRHIRLRLDTTGQNAILTSNVYDNTH